MEKKKEAIEKLFFHKTSYEPEFGDDAASEIFRTRRNPTTLIAPATAC